MRLTLDQHIAIFSNAENMSVKMVSKELKLPYGTVRRVLRNGRREPLKSDKEKVLFDKYYKWILADHIPLEIIKEYKSELLKL